MPMYGVKIALHPHLKQLGYLQKERGFDLSQFRSWKSKLRDSIIVNQPVNNINFFCPFFYNSKVCNPHVALQLWNVYVANQIKSHTLTLLNKHVAYLSYFHILQTKTCITCILGKNKLKSYESFLLTNANVLKYNEIQIIELKLGLLNVCI